MKTLTEVLALQDEQRLQKFQTLDSPKNVEKFEISEPLQKEDRLVAPTNSIKELDEMFALAFGRLPKPADCDKSPKLSDAEADLALAQLGFCHRFDLHNDKVTDKPVYYSQHFCIDDSFEQSENSEQSEQSENSEPSEPSEP